MDVGIRVVVFKDEHAWIAHCLEYDIGTQAPDLLTLKRRLALTMQVELSESLERTGQPFGGIGPSPKFIQDMWQADSDAFRSSGSASTEHGRPASVHYEMALCA